MADTVSKPDHPTTSLEDSVKDHLTPEENETGEETPPNATQVREQRFRIRAAVNQIYNTHHTSISSFKPEPEEEPLEAKIEETSAEEPGELTDEEALAATTSLVPVLDEAERARKNLRLGNFFTRAEVLARNGDEERARQIYSQAVRLAPENSDAWCGLGRLLMKHNQERAEYCLTRSIVLDPENKLATLLLKTLDEVLHPERIPEARALVKAEPATPASTELAPEIPGSENALEEKEAEPEPETTDNGTSLAIKQARKIGLEEVLTNMRASGVDTDPESIPQGGPKLRSAIESGILKPGREQPRSAFKISARSLALLALVFSLLIFGGGLKLYLNNQEPAPTEVLETTAENGVTSPETGISTPTRVVAAVIQGPDEIFAGKLRVEVERYNTYLISIKSLIDQQRANKLQWENFRKGFDDIQKQLKNEKKNVDTIAVSAVPRLLNPYKALQDLALTMNAVADYMVSGIHNYEPDDLDEALRQFSRASNQLAEVASQLNQLAPLPTPTSIAPSATPVPPTLTQVVPTPTQPVPPTDTLLPAVPALVGTALPNTPVPSTPTSVPVVVTEVATSTALPATPSATPTPDFTATPANSPPPVETATPVFTAPNVTTGGELPPEISLTPLAP